MDGLPILEMKLKILDLCCGEGGAAMGYHLACKDAGIEADITGVDIEYRKYYPFRFIQGDALDWGERASDYDFIHASPPCQKFSPSTSKQRLAGVSYPDLIGPIRQIILDSGKPGCIENVPQAPISADVVLWGNMFGLPIIRRRHFELVNWFFLSPPRPKENRKVKHGELISIFGKAGYRKYKKLRVGWRPSFDKGTCLKTWQYAMGMDWVGSDVGISEAIPPAYTRFIFMNYLEQCPS